MKLFFIFISLLLFGCVNKPSQKDWDLCLDHCNGVGEVIYTTCFCSSNEKVRVETLYHQKRWREQKKLKAEADEE